MGEGDLELTFPADDVSGVGGGGAIRLRAHSSILKLTSAVLGAMLRDLQGNNGNDSYDGDVDAGTHPALLRLQLDDAPQGWRAILPMLYPRMSAPPLTWLTTTQPKHIHIAKVAVELKADVRLVIGIAHKYDIPLVLQANLVLACLHPLVNSSDPPKNRSSQSSASLPSQVVLAAVATTPAAACEQFLLGERDAPLSYKRSDPNYVLYWLEISERLHLDAFRQRCLRYIRTGIAAVGGTTSGCDYCVASGGGSGGGSGASSSSSSSRYRALTSRYAICVCACRTCGGHRRLCGCDRGMAAAALGAIGVAAMEASGRQQLRLHGLRSQGLIEAEGVIIRSALEAELEALGRRAGFGERDQTVAAAATGGGFPPAQVPVRRRTNGIGEAAELSLQALSRGLRPSSFGGYSPASAGGGSGSSRSVVPVRSVVLRDREGLSRLSVRSLVDLLEV
ncbi:hypothetical protein VOLCADRAFT_89942 [Volvox carteri f. nagariensis]|uniref:BTB domain-containing protein n=1 Tax=Volvox carteri f. nagariensis TaxID=3068 RepID=D8TT26_VOLCA|nr:uncharacterized protein VOLCADRAFT_89942 [Volvox carteri f. nagariensis]EFJ49582.1 hypothetical protein VOLCADRAFT_89942 [Volvox carteri f. nagariensis]|eukprot:XP_002949563.1 hypothetical protein VOLCADRAFT_89942 [Volvox carteri f. nagariensis]